MARQGAWAIADQGLFALAGFVLNLLLARWLGPEQYGVFGVAFTVFLLVGLVYTSLVIEPLLVFGSGRWRASYRAYLFEALRLLGGIAALGGLLLWAVSIAVAWRAEAEPLAQALRTMIWAAPCIVLQWALRRACYVHGRPDIAATGGVLYLFMIVGSTAWIQGSVGLDARMGFAVMAGGSVLTVVFLAWRLASTLPLDAHDGPGPPRMRADVWRTHWRFGRWVLASAVVGWFSLDVFFLILAPQHGFAAAGAVRAAYNLVLPVLHVLTALSTVALPWFVAALRSGGALRAIAVYWSGLTVLALAYGAALVLSSGLLVPLLYGASFEDIGPLVRVFALLPVATATGASLATVLRAMERPREVFVATALAALLGAGLGIPLTLAFGALGAVSAIVVNGAVYAIAIFWRLRRLDTDIHGAVT